MKKSNSVISKLPVQQLLLDGVLLLSGLESKLGGLSSTNGK